MNSKKKLLNQFKLYAVTDLKGDGAGLLEKVEAAYRGGVDIVQLRAKAVSDGTLLALAKKIKAIAAKAGKLFFINDRTDIALISLADGVHLGQEDMPIADARLLARRAGAELLVGKSTHSLDQAKAAFNEGADYIGVGPVFTTPTKPGRAAVGLELVRQVTQAKLPMPFVAIGGIDLTNIQQVLDAGAQRVACVRAIFDQEDVYHAAEQLSQQWSTVSHVIK
jgi:thiamine-phosphate pyrophosphorylase